VKWDGTVKRDSLSISTRNSLGAIATLFLLPPDAADEVEKLLAGVPVPQAAPVEAAEDETQVDLIFKDIQNKAFEFIKDKITKLQWDEMQELVAGLLRAMGYKTRISPSGPDRGKDIVASPDGFGFESPRIVVEVKHRTASAMGSQEVRSFLGGRHKDDKGLYVSTGGFSKDARYEAERAAIPLTLMDLDDLVRAILEHYERMDGDSQRLVTLRKIYWPG
jgi:restriction system protein